MYISNVRVYDLEESIVASGFPMDTMFDVIGFLDSVDDLKAGKNDAALQRAVRLASMPDGSGHKNFLSGILVSFNVTATQVWWMQFERYHFAQIVSSMSKMHRLKLMIQTGRFKFHEKVFENGQVLLQDIEFNGRGGEPFDEEELVYNCPMGLELTARVTTNYLQLRTIYVQRRSHKLQEWRDFCAWIASLPYARELITLEGGDADHEK